ncbi:MAG TPA: Calx-beta domain-containing protein [Thermoanaerobaculia bacterium]|nr:Calx-beta domain-containing protein [Thermoanaerobaculia bacterium]
MLHRHYLAAALILAAAALPASAATVKVTVGGADLVFTPQTVSIQTGDTVTWTNAGGGHNVASDDGSFSNAVSGSAWTFSHTYTAAGTFGYHCSVHGSPGSGMFGTVVVADAGGGGGGGTDQPGTLGFSLADYSVNEGAGTATLAVQRTGGDDGAVSVQYAATAGTATAGQDFNPASGTLSWADKDDATKTFTVRVIDDTTVEANETVLLALSNPTGGATLTAGRATATLTIKDNDTGGGGGGGALAAPSNLQATAVSTGEIDLTWNDNSNNETGFSVERRTVTTPYEVVATVGPNTRSAAVTGLDAGSFSLFRVRATGSGSTFSPYSAEAASATLATPAPCVAGTNTLCVNNNRFKIEVVFNSSAGSGSGFAVPLASAPTSGLFYFFDPTNIEMLIKVLNACVPPFNHYWVYFAATTNVEFATVVTDTQNGQTRAYFNPLNRAAVPVQDGNAFATCP